MARRRYRRRYRRRSTRWCPNISRKREIVSASSGWFSENYTLAANPTQNLAAVSQIYTVKNFEFTFTLEPQNASAAKFVEDLCAYIMYVPEGMTVDSDYANKHPEYIMAYKYLGSPTGISYAYTSSGSNMYEGQQFQPVRIRTRLSRKLNTGDQVILYITGYNEDNSSQLINMSGILRWWTKAN